VKKVYSGYTSEFPTDTHKLKVVLKPCDSTTWIGKIPAGEREIQ
jgi:hypothetical protein